MNTNPTTLTGLVEHWREARPAQETLRVDFGDLVIEVGVDTPKLLDSLKSYFREFLTETGKPDICISTHEAPAPDLGLACNVKQPDPGKTKIKEEWADIPGGRVVRKRITGMVFFFGNGLNAAVGPCSDNDNQVINFVNNRYIEHKLQNGCLLGHAAAVSLNGRGMSLAGFSGMGKSTLALHMMNLDMTFVSNDRIMARPAEGGQAPTMYGVAKHPRINPGTLIHNEKLAKLISAEEKAKFEAMPQDELWDLELKYDAPIDICYGPDKFKLMSPMDYLVILNWQRDGAPLKIAEVDPAERNDLLPAFMKPAGLFFLPPGGADGFPYDQPTYVDGLKGCKVVEISGGVDFETAAKACRELLEK